MAAEIRAFDVLTPAGTAKATPLLTNVSMPPRSVDRIQIRVPPGPSGQMGFAIAAAGQPIIPYNAGGFIVGDDEFIDWPVQGYITSGAWQVLSYNTGQYDHTIELRFLLSLVRDPAPTPPAPPTLIDLSSLPEQSAADTAAAQASLDALLGSLTDTVP